MKLSHPRIAIVLMAACFQMPAPAAESSTGTWRCGNTYTDQPCTGGKTVDLDDARSASQKREADSTTREARAAADRLERDRVRLENAQARRKAALIDNKPREAQPALPKRGASVAQKAKRRKDAEYFSANDPLATAKKKAAKAVHKSAARD